ncbi:hypothetical protein LAC81_35650 (plasmid) [Ensifer adhaerens]|nr:hypothetical protein LAC78_36950 [Ensifer adhaerens]UAY05677.1 hypothetical protein LAC80_35655 [Ensifer adhaerens]UAY13055.1 hypothetical protein LAC81_35650 [Ensifer adhaerens]
MNRFAETEIALIDRLRSRDIGVPLTAAGFTQDEIMEVLYALEQDRFIVLLPGNRLMVLKDLPQV